MQQKGHQIKLISPIQNRSDIFRAFKQFVEMPVESFLVARFDRFARSTRPLILALDEFNALGVDLISLSESVDTSTPMGKMVYAVIAAVAELERSLIRERVVTGLQRAKAQGKPIGRPKTEVDEQKVHSLRSEGLSLRAIGQRVGVSRTKVQKVLSRNTRRSEPLKPAWIAACFWQKRCHETSCFVDTPKGHN